MSRINKEDDMIKQGTITGGGIKQGVIFGGGIKQGIIQTNGKK